MPWNWNVHGEKVGRPAEAAAKATWQDYDAEYLKYMLRGDASRNSRFDTTDLNDAEKQVYLQEVTKGYEREAEACLKQEFKQWLQGTHEENVKAKDKKAESYYQNKMSETDGGPKRRSIMGDPSELLDNQGDGDGHTGWQATRWGTKPLTHLEGVRDFLRQDMVEDDNTERDMNLLAHYGPQNLDEAWIYFKHWVKRRPVHPMCLKREGLSKIDPANPRMNGTGPSNWNELTPDGKVYGPKDRFTLSGLRNEEEIRSIDLTRGNNLRNRKRVDYLTDGEPSPSGVVLGGYQTPIRPGEGGYYKPPSGDRHPWTVGPARLMRETPLQQPLTTTGYQNFLNDN